MSSLAFSFFRALSHFSELPLRDKLLRVFGAPYFIVKACTAPTPTVTSPFKSLHELPASAAVDPQTQARAPFDYAALKGRPVLVVNVASACGLTHQNYTELAHLYEPLKERTQLEVLAFPCNQFMAQEKGARGTRVAQGALGAPL